jgi:hypothetical protein
VTGGPRILVGDAEQRSVLATCRGFAAAGYRVSTVGGERFALAHWLRFGRVQQQRIQVVDEVGLLEAPIAVVGVPLTLQEYVSDATLVWCAAVRVDGQLLGLKHARYIRTYTSQRGSAALATTIAPPGRSPSGSRSCSA